MPIAFEKYPLTIVATLTISWSILCPRPKAPTIKYVGMATDFSSAIFNFSPFLLIQFTLNNSNLIEPCSAYSKFRDCVNVPLGNECGAKARNLMHHSLAFLMQKCDSSSDSGRSYENDCVSFPGQRAPKHSAIDHHSHHHHAKHQPASSAGPEAENDYYMNEKHFEGVHDDSESKTKPDNGFQPILPVNMTRTVISRPTAEPEAQNLRKASDSEFPDAAGADTADYDSEPEVASVSSIAHHSTESPQFVRYDSESAGNGIMNIHQNNLISIFLIIWLAFYFPFISSN